MQKLISISSFFQVINNDLIKTHLIFPLQELKAQ